MRRIFSLALSLAVAGCNREPSASGSVPTAPENGPTSAAQSSTLFRPGMFTFQVSPVLVSSSPDTSTCQAYVNISPLIVSDSLRVYLGADGRWHASPAASGGGNGEITVISSAASAAHDGTLMITAQITGTMVDMNGPVPSDTIAHDVSATFPLHADYLPSQLSGTVSADGRSASGLAEGEVWFPVASKHSTIVCVNPNSVRWALQAASPTP